MKPALIDWDTYRSGRGTVLEIVKAGVEIPPGILLFEDPPIHDAHRALLSRVFTPRRMLDLEPLVRPLRRALDALVGRDEFDVIGEFGVEIPLRTIGFLFGIPEDDQDLYRKSTDDAISHRRHTDLVRPVLVRRRALRARPTTSSGVRGTRPTI